MKLISVLILLLKVNARLVACMPLTLTHATQKGPTFFAFAGTLNSRGISGINLGGADFGGTTGKEINRSFDPRAS